MKIDFLALPKIDLHHHFDGAFLTGELYKEAQRRKLPQGKLPANEFAHKVTVTPQCNSLTEFLDTFHFFYDIAKDSNFLYRQAKILPVNLKKDGVIYCETRFAPDLFCHDNIHSEQIVEEVLGGLADSPEKSADVRLLLCAMRGSKPDIVQDLLYLYEKYHKHGVAGIDLAGDESKFSGDEYTPIFRKAMEKNIPVTIHAGEAAGPESVRRAIFNFHARRIGHGVQSIGDTALLKTLIEKQICLEICLTSNIQTGTMPSYTQHPFGKLYEQGVRVTVNTDDPSVSGIKLSGEWEIAQQTYALTDKDIQKILLNSAKSAFCEESQRKNLISRINGYFNESK